MLPIISAAQIPKVLQNLRLETATGYDIIPVIGQSNAMGTVAATLASPANARILQFNQADTVVAAGDFLNFPQGDYGAGPAYTFGLSVLPYLHPNRTILFVPMAVGGTGFSNGSWNKGNTRYNNALAQVQQALALPGTNRILCTIWQQVEDDMNTHNANYRRLFRQFVSDWRSDLSLPTLPFVLGEPVPFHIARGLPQREVFREWVQTAPFCTPYIGCATAYGLVNTDNIHFDGNSSQQLGRRYLGAFVQAMQNTTPHSLFYGQVNVRGTSLTTFTARLTKAYPQWYRTQFRYRTGGGAWTTSAELVNTKALDVSGLTSGATYEVQGRIFSEDLSRWTTWSNSTTVSLAGLPGSTDISLLGDVAGLATPFLCYSTVDLSRYACVEAPFALNVERLSDSTTQFMSGSNYEAALETFVAGTEGQVRSLVDQTFGPSIVQTVQNRQPRMTSGGQLLRNSQGNPSSLYPGTGGIGTLETGTNYIIAEQKALTVVVKWHPKNVTTTQRIFHVLDFRFILFINAANQYGFQAVLNAVGDSLFPSGAATADLHTIAAQVNWGQREMRFAKNGAVIASKNAINNESLLSWTNATRTVRISDTTSGMLADADVEAVVAYQEAFTDNELARLTQQIQATGDW